MRKPKTYYIVESRWHGKPCWYAHTDGLWARLGQFDLMNMLMSTCSLTSADECQAKLLQELDDKSFPPRVMRVVKA